jgi:hypothetical protein
LGEIVKKYVKFNEKRDLGRKNEGKIGKIGGSEESMSR